MTHETIEKLIPVIGVVTAMVAMGVVWGLV